MSRHLERDLEVLERELLALSSMAEEMVAKAARALKNRDAALAQSVIEQDLTVNRREVVIEEECLKILALHQPVAVDLRRTATILKINNDLERIADLAVNISERAVSLTKHPDFAPPIPLTVMADRAIEMVRKALDAFVNLDADAAREVCLADEQVDSVNRQVIDELQAVMKSDPAMVEPAMHFFSAARHVERIADHATNIAEDVMYLVEGEIYRHQHHAGGSR